MSIIVKRASRGDVNDGRRDLNHHNYTGVGTCWTLLCDVTGKPVVNLVGKGDAYRIADYLNSVGYTANSSGDPVAMYIASPNAENVHRIEEV